MNVAPWPFRDLGCQLVGTAILALACVGGDGRSRTTPLPPPPPAICDTATLPVDTSSPTSVVGNGTPASCTEAALRDAIRIGGLVTFACGTGSVVIPVRSELVVTADTVVDGGGRVTLDGLGATRILAIRSSYELTSPHLVVQHLALTRGRSSGADVAGGGGAIYRLGGRLTVIDAVFLDNEGPLTGQDVAGGAISSIGGGSTVVVGSRFAGNTCSNGGAIGNLGNDLLIMNSTLSGNRATGSWGGPESGGNGGAISFDGAGTSVAICGVTMRGNVGNAHGGAFFRVAYAREPTTFERCTIDGNSIPDQAASLGGGLYLQNTSATITDSTISGNSARAAGGVFFGPDATVQVTNVTFDGNTALSSLGGALSIDSGVSGTLLNVTFTRNRALGSVAFAGAIAGGNAQLLLANTVIAYSQAGNAWNPISCSAQLGDGGGNVQWPVMRAGGTGSDDPGALCTRNVLVADPLLGPLSDQGGPTMTVAPTSGSPAIGRGTGCPATDQRGVVRSSPCTSGAYEAP